MIEQNEKEQYESISNTIKNQYKKLVSADVYKQLRLYLASMYFAVENQDYDKLMNEISNLRNYLNKL